MGSESNTSQLLNLEAIEGRCRWREGFGFFPCSFTGTVTVPSIPMSSVSQTSHIPIFQNQSLSKSRSIIDEQMS